MLKPQEIREATFVKVVFGGYDMKSVDDFLDQVNEEYTTLYNENTSLKQKLRVLVQKLEEYRAREDALNQAETMAAAKLEDAEKKAKGSTKNSKQPNAYAMEEKRVEGARQVAAEFIQTVEDAVSRHLELLDGLKKLTAENRSRPYDYDSEPDAPVTAQQVAKNVGRYYGDEAANTDETKIAPALDEEQPIPDLQFGPNYNPKG